MLEFRIYYFYKNHSVNNTQLYWVLRCYAINDAKFVASQEIIQFNYKRFIETHTYIQQAYTIWQYHCEDSYKHSVPTVSKVSLWSNKCINEDFRSHQGLMGPLSGPLFTKKTPCYGYRDPHYKPKMVWRTSQVYIMGIPILIRRRALSE